MKKGYRIGEFSKLAKLTVKTLRYYDEVGLLSADYVDSDTGYRYYQTHQLVDAQKISELRQLGISIDEIVQIRNGAELTQILMKRKASLLHELEEMQRTCAKIEHLLTHLKESNIMKYQTVTKKLPSSIVYSRRGKVDNFSKLPEFVLDTGAKCQAANPNLKCPEPGYCFTRYLDGEFRDHNISLEYVEAVCEMGKDTDDIHFTKLAEVQAICILHVGPWDKLGDAYAFAMNYIETNGYELSELPRECYIDGPWNKNSVDEYLTELQFPIK